jgi:integrase
VKRHAEDGTTAGDRTFKAAAARWVARLERDGCSARWIGEARRMVGLATVKRGAGVRYFPPSFLSKAVGDITRADAAAVLSKVAAPYMRNKVRMVIGAVWRHEADLGLFPDDRPSPIARVKRTKPVKRQRALGETDGTEWKRLGRAWRTLTNEIGEVNDTRRTQADFVVLALLTGARKDALRLRTWGDVDFGAAILRVRPEHKGVSSVVLGDAAVNYLRRMHDAAGAPPDDAFIFPGQRAGRRRSVESAPPKPLTRPDGPFWNALRERANVPDLRLHDLRRSFRSTAGEIGVPVGAAEKLIGHSLAGIVGVYDVVSADALKKAADTTAAAVADRLGMGDLTAPPKSRGVLPMKRRATR